LRGRIDELNRQLDNANNELRDLRYDVGQLQSYNEIIGEENVELRKMLRLRSAPQQDTGSNADIESEDDARPSKRHRKEKGKKPMRHSEDEMEVDDDGARVRQKASF
jgi:regulator of replication initiation timing